MPVMTGHNSGGDLGPLPGFVERIEKLEDERRLIAAEIASVKAEAKTAGFDVKVIKAILAERRLSAYERQEYATLLELYRAALGMLDGTPLGEAARKRLMGERKPPPSGPDGQTPSESIPRSEPEQPAIDIEAARKAGREAAKAGAKIIDNPFVAGDPRRAAWDEGWCAETGSDGMEIPEAWRRSSTKKKSKGKDDEPGEDGKPAGEGAPEGGDE
jgi:uncharacterized protein (UPF0335 family)